MLSQDLANDLIRAEVPFEFLEPYNDRFFNCPHLHLYVEGYDDRWAIPVPEDCFGNINDMYETLMDFFSYCNVIDPPLVSRELFL